MTRTIRYTGSRRDLVAEALRMVNDRRYLECYVEDAVIRERGWLDGEHIHTICRTIQHFLDESPKRGLVITCPPRHTKSVICSAALPAWWLGTHPQGEVVLASYTVGLARDNGAAFRAMLDGEMHRRLYPHMSLAIDSLTTYMLDGKINGKPSVYCVGVGGSLTGKGADIAVIDDPIKDARDASSPIFKRRLVEWYQQVLRTRLSPEGKIIIVETRWTYDDLVGWVLDNDRDNWEVLNLPAISDDGKPLWPERFALDDYLEVRRTQGERIFEAMYQGRPTPAEGGMIRREWLRPPDHPLETTNRVRYWDKAATHGGGDWTVGCLMAEAQGVYVIEDIVRLQGSPAEVQDTIRRTAERDGYDVRIRMEQEPGSSGVDAIDLYARTVLRGYDFRAEKVSGDKVTRASGMASALERGDLRIVQAPWTRDLIDELVQFPYGQHDDQVDACSGAWRELSRSAGGPGRIYLI